MPRMDISGIMAWATNRRETRSINWSPPWPSSVADCRPVQGENSGVLQLALAQDAGGGDVRVGWVIVPLFPGFLGATSVFAEPLQVDVEELAQRTGWVIKPEGACKDDRCVPLPTGSDGKVLDVRLLAKRLGMPLLHDQTHDVWSLGPEAGGHVLGSAVAPEIVLPDLDGRPFALSSLRGQKVLLVAWASW